jgi:hypothetical protein
MQIINLALIRFALGGFYSSCANFKNWEFFLYTYQDLMSRYFFSI